MRCILRPLLFLTLLALASCRADLSDLQVASVDQAAAWRTSGDAIAFCDANNADTRERYGVIPGALLLSNYRDYQVAGELPEDKGRRLVFYCHSETCGAAGDAARKALAAGYRDVWVMGRGITGWVDAGYDVSSGAQSGTQS